MNEQVYELMDWAEIEAIVYAEHDNPHHILGPHMTQNGMLVNVFLPTAKSVTVKLKKNKKSYLMEVADEEGFFAVLIPEKKIVPYLLSIEFDNGTVVECGDPYAFEPVIDLMDVSRFESGIHYEIYEKLGSHPMTIQGVEGVLFAVWAPNAYRVSVVGDFNLWDGRRHPMRRLEASGIFELFIPGLGVGDIYKYELKIRGDLPVLKADPYGNYSELRPATASVVCDLNNFEWTDKEWIKERTNIDTHDKPMLVYEVHLGSWIKPEVSNTTEDEKVLFNNYRELAHKLADYVSEMGYTHIELMPIMEHPLDESWGYQVTGYYATTSRYGVPQDFMYFVDYMHKKGIGVIIDWVPAHFPRDTFGLANFDGTCLYEHLDPRQGSHPHWGTLIFNYGRPQVSNFLIANALFWINKFHVDGIRMDAVASMLYLDYGKRDGEWVANIYGGNENLEAVELLKHLNSIVEKNHKGVLMIAEESTAWAKVTGRVEDGGLGFHYKWNMGWMHDFTSYMQCDPLFRKGQHGNLTFSMIYAYSENFVLVLSHDEVVHGKASMINKMPGELEDKFSNLRVAYGYMTAHPGKKLLFMGQEFAQFSEWNEASGLNWELLDNPLNLQMKDYVKALNKLYKNHKALYEMDYSSEGFEWVNCISYEISVVSFLRKSKDSEEVLLIVCNFTPVVHEEYPVGVPFKGKYKEIFNSDSVEFGGLGNVNPRIKQSKAIEYDERENSINIVVPPLGISVFSCTPMKQEVTTTKKETVSKKEATTKKETVLSKKPSNDKKKILSLSKKAVDEKELTIPKVESLVDKKEAEVMKDAVVVDNKAAETVVDKVEVNSNKSVDAKKEVTSNEKKKSTKTKSSKKRTTKNKR